MIPTTASVVPLAQRWAAGDRQAGDELVRLHDSWILYHARRARRGHESLDDVAQVMRLGFLYQCKLPMVGLAEGQIFVGLRRRMRQWLKTERSRARWASLVNDVDTYALYDTLESLQGRLARNATLAAMDLAKLVCDAELSPQERRAVSAALMGDSLVDVAADLGVNICAARRLRNAAMKKMAVCAGCAEAGSGSVRDQILTALSAGPVQPGTLARDLGRGDGFVRETLRALVKHGVVRREVSERGRHVYVLAKEAA